MAIDASLLVKQLETYLSSNGIKKQAFYDSTGINSANLSQWRNGAYLPSEEKIKAIEEYTGMPIEALLYGNPTDPSLPENDSLKTAQAALFGGLYGRLSEQEMDDLWADVQEFAQFKANQMIRGKGNK